MARGAYVARAMERAPNRLIPTSTSSDPERLGRVIRGLASDLVQERRRANALAREVKELKEELARAQRGS